jgi:hypothetical protein
VTRGSLTLVAGLLSASEWVGSTGDDRGHSYRRKCRRACLFAVDTVRNGRETFTAIVAITVLSVVLDVATKGTRGEHTARGVRT